MNCSLPFPKPDAGTAFGGQPGRRPVSTANTTVNKKNDIAEILVAVTHLHNCGAAYVTTVPVHEVFNGQTLWRGNVEVFDLYGHFRAKRAYAWRELDGEAHERKRFVSVLEISPVESAETAVRFQILKDLKDGKSTRVRLRPRLPAAPFPKCGRFSRKQVKADSEIPATNPPPQPSNEPPANCARACGGSE